MILNELQITLPNFAERFLNLSLTWPILINSLVVYNWNLNVMCKSILGIFEHLFLPECVFPTRMWALPTKGRVGGPGRALPILAIRRLCCHRYTSHREMVVAISGSIRGEMNPSLLSTIDSDSTDIFAQFPKLSYHSQFQWYHITARKEMIRIPNARNGKHNQLRWLHLIVYLLYPTSLVLNGMPIINWDWKSNAITLKNVRSYCLMELSQYRNCWIT